MILRGREPPCFYSLTSSLDCAGEDASVVKVEDVVVVIRDIYDLPDQVLGVIIPAQSAILAV